MRDRKAAWWLGALRSAERGLAQADALLAATPEAEWYAAKPGCCSFAEWHAQLAWLLWDARRHQPAAK